MSERPKHRHQFDMERLTVIADGGLAAAYEDEDAPDDLRLDNFVIVATFAWSDEDGIEHEGTSVWSEARRHYVKRGMLEHGIEALEEVHR